MANYAFRIDRTALYNALCEQEWGVMSKPVTKLPFDLSGSFTLELPAIHTNNSHYVPGGPYELYVDSGSVGSHHRIFVKCKCGRDIPHGRLHQHASSCPVLSKLV